MKPGRRRWLFAVLAGLATGLAACHRKPRLAPLPAGTRVLAFGDSVTYGTGAPPGQGWPEQLAQLSGWQISNGGVPGDTAGAGKGRIKALLDETQPRLVIVEIGGNDFLRHRPLATVKEDLRDILRTIRNSGAQAILIAVPEPSVLGILSRRPSDSPLYKELAEEENVPVIEHVFADILAQPNLHADPIHPNAEGYRQMAAAMAVRLREIGVL